MSPAPLDAETLTGLLAAMALAAPIVLLLVAYDVRWIVLARRAGLATPWGAWVRLAAAALCHGGAALLAAKGAVWPRAQLVWWMHMLLDPGLSLYALGLWDLWRRAFAGALSSPAGSPATPAGSSPTLPSDPPPAHGR